jgi:hypothetical protein
LPEQTKIIGYGRSPKPIEDLHQQIGEHLPGTDEENKKFLKTVCPSRSFGILGYACSIAGLLPQRQDTTHAAQQLLHIA